MWPRAYFALRYFTARYFAIGGSTSPVTPVIYARPRTYAITSRSKSWSIPAMGFPLLNQKLDAFFQGDSLTQPITLTVAVGTLPDPNTWTDIRLSVTAQNGAEVNIGLGDMVTPPVITGTGPWSVASLFPISESDSRSLPATTCSFQVDMAISRGGQAVLVTGLVDVMRPSAALP